MPFARHEFADIGRGEAQAARGRVSARSLASFVVRRRVGVAVILLLTLAFAVRVAAYFEVPRPLGGAGLAAEQGEMARNIVDHGRWFVLNPQAYQLLKKRQAEEHRLVDLSRVDFSRVDREARAHPVVDQMPGLAVVLSVLWWATGDKTYSLIQWLQIMLDTAMVFLVYWIAMRLTQRPSVALVAAALYAIWPKVIIFVRVPSLNTWASFFTIACVAAFLWARHRQARLRRLVLVGLIAGVGIYFRPPVVLVPIALALVAAPGGWRLRLLWMSAPTAVALLLLAPWTIRNYYEFHRFIPTRTGLGQALFEGTGLASSDEKAQAYVHRHQHAKSGSPAFDAVLLHGATTAILDRPGTFFRQVARRTRFLLPFVLILLVWRRWRRATLIPLAAGVATALPYLFIGDEGGFYLPAFFTYFILIGMVAEMTLSFGLWSRVGYRDASTRLLPFRASRRRV